jgi:hypothetical protein
MSTYFLCSFTCFIAYVCSILLHCVRVAFLCVVCCIVNLILDWQDLRREYLWIFSVNATKFYRKGRRQNHEKLLF